ncbi:phenylalanine--tRNA ligase [Tribonema minus]|uniref:phenylalanine--tRNA ligase n=1 Tax=Tribonema minus TaxID=303371 RepID=A0A836CML8_9STRA|nr:phenylalanine--tRNA ligase [Tribonema minus]
MDCCAVDKVSALALQIAHKLSDHHAVTVRTVVESINAKSLGVLNGHPSNNVPASVAAKIGMNLHLRQHHPLNIIKTRIEDYFTQSPALREPRPQIEVHDSLAPVVTARDNFDSLLIPPSHVSRRATDTYYVDDKRVLRTHTSAHQVTLLRRGAPPRAFLVCGDVYRRDEVDRSHYPVFHQMEGVRVFAPDELPAGATAAEREALAVADLRAGLEGLACALFGDVEMRWVDAYFPFTNPSFELEIFFGGKWLEVLGCGAIERDVMRAGGMDDATVGWAFGLGLERLAMVLFSIPDIRLFWSDDARFTSQFKAGAATTFKPYSKYPPCLKDVSFWVPGATAEIAHGFHDNDMYEAVREVAGDMVEEIALVDEFAHPKTGRVSKCFRLTYRSMDRSLTNKEVDALQELVRQRLVDKLGVELR